MFWLRRSIAQLLTVGALLIGASAVGLAQSTLTAAKSEWIDAAVRAATAEQHIPGMSVAVVAGDKTVYIRGFGVADLENPVTAGTNSVYRLGSLSKPITAVAVMQLAEKGKLDLDAPIGTYCPAYPVKQWPLSARQLLAHLGGVRDYNNAKFLEEYFSTRHYDSITESLDIFKADPLLQEPGRKYSYSTYGYVLLGCAVEGAAAMGYEDYIRANVLKPAGMYGTSVDDALRIIPNRAKGYGKTKEGVVRNALFADTSNKIPAGGLVSTVDDLTRFSVALQSGLLLKSSTLDEMWTIQKTRDGKATPYGLGWRVGARPDGLKEIYHGGAASGFSAFFYLLPEKKITVVLLANMELLGPKQRDDLARRIADEILK